MRLQHTCGWLRCCKNRQMGCEFNINVHIRQLKQIIELLNKSSKIQRYETKPGLLIVIAMRKHIYIDNLNVRRMVEDSGYLSKGLLLPILYIQSNK